MNQPVTKILSVPPITVVAKPGIWTSEFWFSAITSIGSIIGGFSGLIPEKWALVASTVTAAFYAISRAISKKPPAVQIINP